MGTLIGSTFTATGAATAATASADPNSFGATLSGANLSVNAATAVSGNNDSTAQYWSWTLSTLGVTIPSDTRLIDFDTRVSSFSEGARTGSSVSSVLVALGTGAQVSIRASGFARPGTGSSYNNARTGGSAAVTSFTGSSTVVRFLQPMTVGDTFNAETLLIRMASGNDIDNGVGLSGLGAISATIPTHLNLYVQVTGANTTTAWTLNDFEGYVRW